MIAAHWPDDPLPGCVVAETQEEAEREAHRRAPVGVEVSYFEFEALGGVQGHGRPRGPEKAVRPADRRTEGSGGALAGMTTVGFERGEG